MQGVKISVDTNVLVRTVLKDDAHPASKAIKLLEEASLIAVSLPCLCEFVWVLRRGFRLSIVDVAAAIRTLLDAQNVAMNRPAVEAGMSMLEAGGDFADGIIAHESRWLGGETFVSFDAEAVRLLNAQGQATRLLT